MYLAYNFGRLVFLCQLTMVHSIYILACQGDSVWWTACAGSKSSYHGHYECRLQ